MKFRKKCKHIYSKAKQPKKKKNTEQMISNVGGLQIKE